MGKTAIGSSIIALVLTIFMIGSDIQLISYLFGEVQYKSVHLNAGNIAIPQARTIVWEKQSDFAKRIYLDWAGRAITDDMLEGKGNVSRILLAKLLLKQDITEVNQVLRKLQAWGVSGSSWAMNKKGDYDFSLMVFTTILYLFGDQPELLYPESKEHLLQVLLIEKGNKYRSTAPKTFGLVKETENHLLMTEGSRYLKNRWIMLHGNSDSYYDNVRNGLEAKIISLLQEMKSEGLYEFNSLPYIGYTISALLNLEAFASNDVRKEARDVLDYINWCYALGSYQLKHYPPMRRRYEKAAIQQFNNNYHSAMMQSWLGYFPEEKSLDNIEMGKEHALMSASLPYRPTDEVVEKIFRKDLGYFVKLGHGPMSSPEIYAAGKGFLLSAGGVNRGRRSLIVARPIVLFLDDAAQELSETFHLSGPGADFMNWNNTGVYRNFACAAGPVIIPPKFTPKAVKNNWSIYSFNDGVSVAVFSTDKFGLMAVFEGENASGLLEKIILKNPAEDKLNQYFQFPDGQKIGYDVNAPKNKWVIVSENDHALDREFDKWPLIEGTIN